MRDAPHSRANLWLVAEQFVFCFWQHRRSAYIRGVILRSAAWIGIPLATLIFVLGTLPSVAATDTYYETGAARVDITPDYPIRLSGYGGRTKESEGVDQHIFASALAIGKSKKDTAILLTVENVAVPANIRDELTAFLKKEAGVSSGRVTLCSTHVHTAPMLKDVCPNLFGADIPAEQQERIDRYTRELVADLKKVSLLALSNRQPATLAWGRARAGFAANRRTPGGPVDQDLPVLVARDKAGNIRAIIANYACHCTTLADTPNHICGDWAGYAQEYLERDHPGAVALITIGCGGDADPKPRTGLDFAKQNGNAISTAINELLQQPLTPLHGKLECRMKSLTLPFDVALTREQWLNCSQSTNHWIAYHAKKNLARLDRGEKIPAELPYAVQEWNFGNELAMVFLSGEVVVDYSLRLKKEFDATRLWVTAYANDVPCYIPSRRIWQEGGYEGGGAMIYYDRPTRLAEGTEESIIAAVHEIMPRGFLAGK